MATHRRELACTPQPNNWSLRLWCLPGLLELPFIFTDARRAAPGEGRRSRLVSD